MRIGEKITQADATVVMRSEHCSMGEAVRILEKGEVLWILNDEDISDELAAVLVWLVETK